MRTRGFRSAATLRNALKRVKRVVTNEEMVERPYVTKGRPKLITINRDRTRFAGLGQTAFVYDMRRQARNFYIARLLFLYGLYTSTHRPMTPKGCLRRRQSFQCGLIPNQHG